MEQPRFSSSALADMPRPDYADVIMVPVSSNSAASKVTDPEVWARTMFSAQTMPRWVVTLMSLRQMLVGLIGIKRAPRTVFDRIKVYGEEALIIADDSHLNFRCGVAFDAERLLLRTTTAVAFQNWRGRLYFLPVRVFHPLVVHAMMVRTVRELSRLS
ncbi:DUF2867 domain-containing protein [Psychromicrobium lacuslunae]|uniref:DUF2867 domain-containing protein n=1 Tax=Psychromicrobium lacuslunae TaxID=1618207 RepID=A0A0D4BW24_9MICC|nr:DUF2867 domain-containing protein [Psychromicrobium lacuslunae]AJT40647.1 hypothetical protein UM93_02280 [Psychromicrobium lacuslunae]